MSSLARTATNKLTRRGTSTHYHAPRDIGTVHVRLASALAVPMRLKISGRLSADTRVFDSPDAWLAANSRVLDRYSGRWLAVAASGIVGLGESLPDVRRQATERGIGRDAVVVMKVPQAKNKKSVSAKRL